MRPFFAVFTVVLVALHAFAATVRAQETPSIVVSGETDFRGLLKALQREGKEVSTGSIELDRANNTLNIRNLVVIEPNLNARMSLNELAVSAFKAGGDGYRFDGAVIDGLKLETGDGSAGILTIDHLRLGKSFLPELSSFKADPDQPVTGQVSLFKLLSRASITDAAATQIWFGAGYRAETVTVTKFADGEIATLEAKNISKDLARTNLENSLQPVADNLSIYKVSLKNINIATYSGLFDESAYLSAGAGRPWSNLIGSVSVEGFALNEGALAVAFESAQLSVLKARQFPRNITSLFDSASRDAEYLVNHPDVAGLIAEYVRQAFALESAHISVLDIVVRDSGAQVHVNIGDAKVANIDATHIDRIEVSAAKVVNSDGSSAIQKLRLMDLNVAEAMGAAEETPATTLTKASIPTVGSIVAEGFDLNVAGLGFSFEKFYVGMSYFVGPVPTNIRASVSHAKFPVSQISDAGLRQNLVDLGYNTIDLSADLSGSWRDSDSAIAFEMFRIAGEDMGTLTLSGSLTGITRHSIENPTSSLPSEFIAGGLRNFRLSFENNSLIDRVISQISKVNNKTPGDVKKLLSANIPIVMSEISSPSIKNKFIFTAVSFINNPKILDLVATSSSVVPIKQIVDALDEPYKLPVIMSLDASANNRR